MQQITLTLDLTLENLKLLAKLIDVPTFEDTEKPKEPKAETKITQNKAIGEKAPKAQKPTIEEPTEPAESTAETEADSMETVSKTDVRALALQLSKAGKQETLKIIFAKFGADKLSAINETDYPALMKELVKANG